MTFLFNATVLALTALLLAAIVRAQHRRGAYAPLAAWWRSASRLARGIALALVLTAVAYGSDKIFGGHIDAGMRTLGGAVASLCTNVFTSAEQQTGYATSAVRTNETHDLAMPAEAQMAERIARRGAHNDGFYFFDTYTNRLAHDGLDLGKPVWVHTDGTLTVRSPAPGLPIQELAQTAAYSNITVYAPLQSSYGFLPASKWPDFMPSLIWAAMTDSGSRVVTWEGARLDRDVAQPVSFQAEFHENGEVTYRFDTFPTNGVATGVFRNGAALAFNSSDPQNFREFLGFQDLPEYATLQPFNISTLQLSYIGDLGDGSGDTDDDGLTNWQEIKQTHTDPHRADTDCDGLMDGYEVQNGTDPLNPDTDGDGIPDGAAPEAWSNNVLRATAETANFSVTLLEAVPPGGHAALRVGDLTVPLSAAGTYWFNLPTNAVNSFTFAAQGCDGLLLDASATGNGLSAPHHVEDAGGILGTGRRASSGTFSVYWPWFWLMPRDGPACLHADETWRIFDVVAGPMAFSEIPADAIDLENMEPDAGGYRLELDSRDAVVGTLWIRSPWLTGDRFAIAEIHKCHGWGYDRCRICGVFHDDDPCSHESDCPAGDDPPSACTCPPLLVRVNIDDDNGNGIEDRDETGAAGEDDLVAFRPLSTGRTCCCHLFGEARESARVTSFPACLRVKKGDGAAFSGGIVNAGEHLVLEALSQSGSGTSAVCYDILDGEGEPLQSVSRKIVAANALLQPDYDGDGNFTLADRTFAQAHGLGENIWHLPPRATPFRIRVRHEIPSGCSLRAKLTGNATALVSYGNAAPTTQNGDTFFTLPAGSGTCELSISSPGVEATGEIKLVMTDAEGHDHDLASQTFTTVASIIERGRYITATNNPGRVRIRLDPGLAGFTANWSISPAVDGGARLYASETGGTPQTSVYGASQVWVSAGSHCRNYSIAAALDRYGLADSADFKACGILFEPVSIDLYNGRYINPSHVIVGSNAYFKVFINGDVMDSDITWRVSSPSVFMPQDVGTTAIVAPASEGDYSLTVEISDFEGPKPQIGFKAVELTTTFIRAYILGTNNVFMTTPQQVANYIAGVNKIYEQAGMRFLLENVITTNVDESWLFLELNSSNADKPKRDAICNIAQNTGGLELYFIHGFDQPVGALNNYNGQAEVMGIILPPNVTSLIVAHEIGHSCGLPDIYVNDNIYEHTHSNPLESVSGGIRHAWMPDDWGSTSLLVNYYHPVVDQPMLIRALLMYGFTSEFKGDIPRGNIYGIWYIDPPDGDSAMKSLAHVSFDQFATRNPVHR